MSKPIELCEWQRYTRWWWAHDDDKTSGRLPGGVVRRTTSEERDVKARAIYLGSWLELRAKRRRTTSESKKQEKAHEEGNKAPPRETETERRGRPMALWATRGQGKIRPPGRPFGDLVCLLPIQKEVNASMDPWAGIAMEPAADRSIEAEGSVVRSTCIVVRCGGCSTTSYPVACCSDDYGPLGAPFTASGKYRSNLPINKPTHNPNPAQGCAGAVQVPPMRPNPIPQSSTPHHIIIS